jgi:hypothetical protein
MAIIAVAASKVLEAHSALDEQRLQRRAIKNPARLADHAGAGSRWASL